MLGKDARLILSNRPRNRPLRKDVESWADEVHLLSKKEPQALFPDCIIEREKLLGVTKSFIAVRKAGKTSAAQ